MEGHVRGGQTRLRPFEQRKGPLPLAARGGHARAQEKGQRIAPARLLAQDRLGVSLHAPEQGLALAGVRGLRGHAEPPPRPRVEPTDETGLHEPVQRASGPSPRLVHALQDAERLPRVESDVRHPAPEPQVEIVEPVTLRPSLEPGLQLLPRARGIVRRQPHHVRAETRAEERRPQAVASPLGLLDEGTQPP